ncbi:MAG TPA: hypothetical protein VF050_02840 [Moraxellaceae bacterium]
MSSFENLPVVPRAPAPWQLRGQGYILAIGLPRNVLDEQSFIGPEQQASRRGRLAYVMFVDYQSSNAGPYHELLYIPGSLQFTNSRHLSISRIFVSTWESVVNGHENWGIPKDRCDFQVRYGADGVDEVRLSRDGKVFAELSFRPRFFRIPFNASWVPRKLRTLAQWFKGREFIYTPEARGHVRPASLLASRFDAAEFPDISQGRVVACVKVTDFDMVFPVSAIRKLQR